MRSLVQRVCVELERTTSRTVTRKVMIYLRLVNYTDYACDRLVHGRMSTMYIVCKPIEQRACLCMYVCGALELITDVASNERTVGTSVNSVHAECVLTASGMCNIAVTCRKCQVNRIAI